MGLPLESVVQVSGAVKAKKQKKAASAAVGSADKVSRTINVFVGQKIKLMCISRRMSWRLRFLGLYCLTRLKRACLSILIDWNWYVIMPLKTLHEEKLTQRRMRNCERNTVSSIYGEKSWPIT